MSYRIWSEVSGGVTGSRAGWLIGSDGKVAEYATREEAEGQARELERSCNLRSFNVAKFRYTAIGKDTAPRGWATAGGPTDE
jgi:hypothetical protein